VSEKKELRFQFQSPGRIIFGQGAARLAGKEFSRLGANRALLVTDEVLKDSEMVNTVKESLGENLAAVFDRVRPDSGLDLVNEGAALARDKGADAVVSVGGGSSMDTAKGICVLLTKQDPDIRPYMGFFKVREKVKPHIAIPTTAGTGSECTSMAVIKDQDKNVKELLVDNNLIPPVAILDPDMTLTMPASLTASTGMDALTHAIEAMVSTRHMPPADALAGHAIRLLLTNLPLSCKDGSDLEARSMNLIAASEAGMAFQNAYVGVVHAMAHALGGQFGVPHGLANALLLPEGMAYNLESVPDRMAIVAQAMGLTPSRDERADGIAAIEKVRALTTELKLPQRLSQVGVKENGLETCAHLALADGAMSTNPRRPEGPEEILEIYRRVF
jgi:aldehyde dehydrogenase (NAD+)